MTRRRQLFTERPGPTGPGRFASPRRRSAPGPAATTEGDTMDSTLTPARAQQVIAEARGRIDDLDARIIALVQQRMGVSAEVQTARIAVGGTRIALSRELEVLARYRTALGPQGTEVAMQLLELCRGRA
ncbi:chorismate mutase [Streptacidiphilus cavernicola]|uniref:Chorismate mutase n=1 Tax=Streptacidiphilus cavernicola TaxID=3342716 RepID=A0ABV6VTS4_9ACTN